MFPAFYISRIHFKDVKITPYKTNCVRVVIRSVQCKFCAYVAVFIFPCQHASRLASIAATCNHAQMRDSQRTQSCPHPTARTLNPFLNFHWAALPWFPVENKPFFERTKEIMVRDVQRKVKRMGRQMCAGMHAWLVSVRGLKGWTSEQHREQVTEQTLFAPPWAYTGWESPGTFPLMHCCNGKTLNVWKLIWVLQTCIGQDFVRLSQNLFIHGSFANCHAIFDFQISIWLSLIVFHLSFNL